MGGTAASCLWLHPACHYDDSAAYQCLSQIYLSDTRLWPRLGLSLAPVHPSATEVLPWRSGHSLPFYTACCRHMAMPSFTLFAQSVRLNKCWTMSADVTMCSNNTNLQSRRDALSLFERCNCVNIHQGEIWQGLLGLQCFGRDGVGGQLCWWHWWRLFKTSRVITEKLAEGHLSCICWHHCDTNFRD